MGNTTAGKNIKPKNLTTTSMTDALTGTPIRARITNLRERVESLRGYL